MSAKWLNFLLAHSRNTSRNEHQATSMLERLQTVQADIAFRWIDFDDTADRTECDRLIVDAAEAFHLFVASAENQLCFGIDSRELTFARAA